MMILQLSLLRLGKRVDYSGRSVIVVAFKPSKQKGIERVSPVEGEPYRDGNGSL